MEKIRQTLSIWNKKIDSIWEDGEKTEETRPKMWKERAKTHFCVHKWDYLFLLVIGSLLFTLAWILPFNEGPDEQMRYLIPQYIYRHGTLPAGYDPEIRNATWGISYAYHPILPYIFGGYLMRLVGIFSDSEKALLMAARFVNVVIGMGFYWYVLQISRKLFQNRLFRCFFVVLLALLPQLLYLFTYVNTDGIAVFSSAIILYYWLLGIERHWDRGSCTGLAIGVSVCALSYFNAYGYALFSIILFVGSMIVIYRKRGTKFCVQAILKRGLFITAIVLLLCGWWFGRCAVLYEGDFLGLWIGDKYAELYAAEAYKPSVKKSLCEQGVALWEMLRSGEQGGMDWLGASYRSTIAVFGPMKYYMGLDIYEISKRIFTIGIIGTGIHAVLGIWEWLRSRKQNRKPWVLSYENCKMETANFLLLQVSLVFCILIPILLSMYYSYCSDFQPQGRYIMPMIIPVMYFTASGVQRVYTLVFRKWLVPFMMIPLFYGVVHVFLSAFLTTFLPTYVEALAQWGNVNIPWLANVEVLDRLLRLLLPS